MDNVFMDFINAVLSQLFGFFLWVLVTPARLVIAALDPVFSPMTALLDFQAFIDGIQTLRPFFADVNYFIPFAAALGILGATIVFAFLWVCFCYAALFNVQGFVGFSLSILSHFVIGAVDKAKQWIRSIIWFFMRR